jgi:hypothetical protein
VTVLAERKPIYTQDADGNAPCTALIGEDGWYFQAVVRPATEAEAQPLLAVEERDARRATLQQQSRELLTWRYDPDPDAQRPTTPNLNGTVRVPYRAGPHGHWATIEDEIRIDEAAKVVWTLIYNGADGDDWSLNNHHPYIATSQPLTEPRRALVAALRAEYAVADLAHHAAIGEEAARTLLAAGWTTERACAELGGFALTTAADVTELLAHTDLWTATGWSVPAPAARRRFPVPDALRLARAGVDHDLAASLAAADVPVAQMPNAASPSVPEHATRLIIKPVRKHDHAVITTNPQTARTWLTAHPDHWQPGLLTIASDVQCVHVEPGWSLWDDGSLAVRTAWIDPAERDQMPHTLTPAAVAALNLVAASGSGTPIRERSLWHPLREATDHTAITVEEKSAAGAGSWSDTKLVRHDFTLPTAVVTWWELATSKGWAGDDADHNEMTQVWPDEATARTAYRNHHL